VTAIRLCVGLSITFTAFFPAYGQTDNVAISFQERVQHAQSLQAAHRYHEALSAFNRLLEDHAEHAEIHHSIASLMAIVSPDDPSCLTYIRRAIELDPDHVQYREALAYSLIRLDLIEEAVLAWKALQNAYPEKDAYRYTLALLYANQRNFKASLRELEWLVSRGNPSADTLALSGRVLLLTGRETEAERFLQRAMVLDGRHLVANVEMGKIAKRNKKWKQAETFFLTAIDVNPFIVEIYNLLGTVYAAMGKRMEAKRYAGYASHLQTLHDNAKSFYDHLIRVGPITFDEHRILGMELVRLGRIGRALQVLELAHAMEPENQRIIVPLTLLYLERGAYEQAYQTIDRLEDRSQWHTEPALAALGWAGFHTGRIKTAQGVVTSARVHHITSDRLAALETTLAQYERKNPPDYLHRLAYTAIAVLTLFLVVSKIRKRY